MKILNKTQMRQEFMRGAFGNHFPAWSFHDYYALGHTELVGLLYNGVPGAILPWYAEICTREQIIDRANVWRILGCDLNKITTSMGEDSYPGLTRVIQGEIMRSEKYYDLTYSTVPMRMREALAQSQQYLTGASAALIIRDFFDAASFDNLQRLWDTYPESVVEFTTFSRPVGNLNQNTIVWEVRNY